MDELLNAAREVGIENLHVLDAGPNPLVSMVHGTHAMQGRIDARWFLDESFTYVKQILCDMHRMAKAFKR